MKLVASVIVRDELDRYLIPFLSHLTGFVDEIRLLDDGSTDGWADRLSAESKAAPVDLDRIHVLRSESSVFFENEGAARQALLSWTLEGEPTHVLAIDADEFVADGETLRMLVERRPDVPAWTLTMQEIWKVADECLCVRQDGGWRPHEVPILYAVPTGRRRDSSFSIADRKLAPGREPTYVKGLYRQHRAVPTGTEILHFGWTCERDRVARHARYVTHDGGRFHQSTHLKSILAPDRRVAMDARGWPTGLDELRPALLERANRPATADAAA